MAHGDSLEACWGIRSADTDAHLLSGAEAGGSKREREAVDVAEGGKVMGSQDAWRQGALMWLVSRLRTSTIVPLR